MSAKSPTVFATTWSTRPYLLCVSVDKPHKNLVMLVRAFGRFLAAGYGGGPRPYLWLAGVRQIGPGLQAIVESELLRDDVRLTRTVEEDELPAVYANARAVAYVSVSEGFGFPLLEAFASGVPIVAANTSSLPEIGGDGAVYVDPSSPDRVANGIRAVWSDDNVRSRVIEHGRKRLELFSWEMTARRTLSVYYEAAGSRAMFRQ